jgi:hypothetical protein
MLDVHFAAFGAFCHRLSRLRLSNRAIHTRESQRQSMCPPLWLRRQRPAILIVEIPISATRRARSDGTCRRAAIANVT